jgi:hypothetical protein
MDPTTIQASLESLAYDAVRVDDPQSLSLVLHHSARDCDEIIEDDSLDTLMHWAATFGSLKCFMVLSKRSPILLYLRSANLSTPLHLACRWGHVEIVHAHFKLFLIVSHAVIEQLNDNGNTPLAEAVIFGHDCVARYLIHRGANVCHCLCSADSVSIPMYLMARYFCLRTSVCLLGVRRHSQFLRRFINADVMRIIVAFVMDTCEDEDVWI